MMIHDITGKAGRHERRKRVGRGESSGMGRTSGRGNKGGQARAGWHRPRPLHIGGAQPTHTHFAKRGFNNFNFRFEYHPINLDDLEAAFSAGAKVDGQALFAAALLPSPTTPFKILGRGALTKKLAITADAISEDAKAAVEKAGGGVTLIARRDSAALWKTKRKSAKGKKRSERPTRLQKKAAARG